MKNDQYFKHDAGASGNQKIMRLIDELGMKGYGAYWMLQETLRMQSNYRASMSTLKRIAHQARVMPAFLLRIINDYGLFVVEADCFYSPGMLRRMRAYDTKTTSPRHGGDTTTTPPRRDDAHLEGVNSLEMSESNVPNARKEEKKEKREEKKKKEEEKKILRQDENEILRQAQDDRERVVQDDRTDAMFCPESPGRPLSLRGARPADGTAHLLRWAAHIGGRSAPPGCLCRVGRRAKLSDFRAGSR